MQFRYAFAVAIETADYGLNKYGNESSQQDSSKVLVM